MNPTHYPYPAPLVAALSAYFGVTYQQYSVRRTTGRLYVMRPVRASSTAPAVCIREDAEGCQIVDEAQPHYTHPCNAWCCAYAWMMSISRLEAA